MPRRLALILLLSAAPAAAGESAFESALSDFRQLHRSEMRRSGIAGSSFYVVRDGRTVAADHLGEQDAEAHVPVDSRTIYHWASITKTMTGIAILQLRDRGLLKLDDPIVRAALRTQPDSPLAAENPTSDLSAPEAPSRRRRTSRDGRRLHVAASHLESDDWRSRPGGRNWFRPGLAVAALAVVLVIAVGAGLLGGTHAPPSAGAPGAGRERVAVSPVPTATSRPAHAARRRRAAGRPRAPVPPGACVGSAPCRSPPS